MFGLVSLLLYEFCELRFKSMKGTYWTVSNAADICGAALLAVAFTQRISSSNRVNEDDEEYAPESVVSKSFSCPSLFRFAKQRPTSFPRPTNLRLLQLGF